MISDDGEHLGGQSAMAKRLMAASEGFESAAMHVGNLKEFADGAIAELEDDGAETEKDEDDDDALKDDEGQPELGDDANDATVQGKRRKKEPTIKTWFDRDTKLAEAQENFLGTFEETHKELQASVPLTPQNLTLPYHPLPVPFSLP